MVNKRAQFFLLAAVIISAVVISLGISANRATVNREPGSFYDYSYEVKRETGAVLDFEIYNMTDPNQEIEKFVDLLAEDIRDKNPDANFKFIYGNNTYLVERDFTSTGANAEAPSTICFSGVTCLEKEDDAGDYGDDLVEHYKDEIGTSGSFKITVEGYDFEFPISEHRQVIFIMQKDVEDESFITVK